MYTYVYTHIYIYIYLYPSHETKRTLSSHRTRVQLMLSPPTVLALTHAVLMYLSRLVPHAQNCELEGGGTYCRPVDVLLICV